ncbi:MAG: peroxiredoxin [Puniceicoccaceae bacterium]
MKTLSVLFLTMFGLFSSSHAAPLAVGAPAPDPTVTDSDGGSLDLGEVYAAGPTLVYFYPKADTPGCTTQACDLRDSFESLTEAGLQVVGVSADKVSSQAAFKEKYSLPFTLVADPGGKLIEAFGVPTRVGFASRQSFLVVDGTIAWRDLKAAPKTQAADALAALKSARGG